MFTTYRTAEMLGEVTHKASATQLWSMVEQDIIWPWFYLQVVRKQKSQGFRSMLMLSSGQDLKKLIEEQSQSFWVDQVQLVTPPHVNGGEVWLMEPLEELCVIKGGQADDLDLLFQVADGGRYILHGRTVPETYSIVETWFSSAQLIFR